MPQSDGMGGTLKRIALQVGDDKGTGWYRFKVNPTQYRHAKPHRTTIFKTKSQIVTEDFGADIQTIQFSGTTGFQKDAQGKTGADRLRALDEFIANYASQGGNGNRSKAEMTFYNFTDDVYYTVHLAPDGIVIERSVDQPLLFNYTISLIVLREADQPSERDIANSQIGNANVSIGGNASAVGNAGVGAGAVGSKVAVVNPNGTQGAYSYALSELKTLTGYGG